MKIIGGSTPSSFLHEWSYCRSLFGWRSRYITRRGLPEPNSFFKRTQGFVSKRQMSYFCCKKSSQKRNLEKKNSPIRLKPDILPPVEYLNPDSTFHPKAGKLATPIRHSGGLSWSAKRLLAYQEQSCHKQLVSTSRIKNAFEWTNNTLHVINENISL